MSVPLSAPGGMRLAVATCSPTKGATLATLETKALGPYAEGKAFSGVTADEPNTVVCGSKTLVCGSPSPEVSYILTYNTCKAHTHTHTHTHTQMTFVHR